jgi:alanine-synthesizing transaminase
VFAARKAIMHYTQQKGVRRRRAGRYLHRQRRVRADRDGSMQALLNDGDEVLLPAPDYPLWTAGVSLSGGTPVHYICDESSGWMPDLDDIRARSRPTPRRS